MDDGVVGYIGVVLEDFEVVDRGVVLVVFDFTDGVPDVAVFVECLVLLSDFGFPCHGVCVTLVDGAAFNLCLRWPLAEVNSAWCVMDFGDAFHEVVGEFAANCGDLMVLAIETAVCIEVSAEE